MKISNCFLWALPGLFFYNFSLAEVNLQTGGYVRRFTDYSLQWQNQEIRIERIYRSRSLASGFFGVGWCSFLDEKINFTNKIAEIHICDDEVSLSLNLQKKDTWQNKDWRLTKTISGFELENKTKQKRLYDQNGWLVRFDKNIQIIRHSKGVPLEISVGLIKFAIEMNTKNLIVQMMSHHQFKTNYKYSEDLLVEVLQNGISLQSFSYDDDDNLSEIKKSQTLIEKIKYDKTHDRVLKINTSESCEKLYQYDLLNSFESVTRILQNCQAKISTVAEVHFWYEPLSAGEVNLVKFETTPRGLASETKSKNIGRKK